MKALFISTLLLAAVAITTASATGPTPAQASMLVTGTITVAPDGSVAGYQLDRAEKLPQAVRQLLDAAIPKWLFRPVIRAGKAVAAHSHMYLRLVAKPAGDGRYSVSLAAASFQAAAPGTRNDARRPPRYPPVAIRGRAQATVYLLARVAEDGRADAFSVRQVNMLDRCSPNCMKKWRKIFARAVLQAARTWNFGPPPGRRLLGHDEHWVAQVPVTFRLNRLGEITDTYGTWVPYVPGPLEPQPSWVDPQLLATADALPSGGVFPLHQALQLITN